MLNVRNLHEVKICSSHIERIPQICENVCKTFYTILSLIDSKGQRDICRFSFMYLLIIKISSLDWHKTG